MVVASWDPGQVLDIEVLRKWCKDCHAKRHLDPTSTEILDWWEEHQGICTINYSGSSGTMEVEGALKIWRHSVEVHKLTYTTMISDGSSSTYPTIAAEKPYGHNHIVKKDGVCRTYAEKNVCSPESPEEHAEQRCQWKGRENGRKGEADRCGDEQAYVGDAKSMQDAVMAIVLPL